jgi:hypothetical protein
MAGLRCGSVLTDKEVHHEDTKAQGDTKEGIIFVIWVFSCLCGERETGKDQYGS